MQEQAQLTTESEPRCRLCLQWTEDDDNTDCLQNIFTEDDTLSIKIRDCLGVFVSPEDSILTICTNCHQTVCLIDEFRTLCRQTEEIYDSVRIRCDDSGRWERYGEYIGELRKLVQEHKDVINEQLDGLEGAEGTADEDSIPHPFVPMMLVKEEPEEEEGWDDGPMTIELLEIKPDPQLLVDESDEEVDVKNAGPSDSSYKTCPMNYDLQVILAQEVWKRVEQFTSKEIDPKNLWAEIAEKLGLTYSATRTRWNRMKQSYKTTKAGVTTGSRLTKMRVKGCTLFNLMNQIVPELDDVEPWVPSECVDAAEQTDGKRLPIGFKIAIAEEIKKNPEVWDTSLASSTHTMDQVWKNIANKLEMDVASIRHHWRSLQGVYRVHRKREREGAKVRTKADTQFYKLIEILHCMRGQKEETSEGEVVKREKEQDMDEEENVSEVLEEHKAEEDEKDKTNKRDGEQFNSQNNKIILAKLVYKHQLLWNQKHSDFYDAPLRDKTWDRIAVSLNRTREEIKYAWKCLRDTYRGRVKRMMRGQLHRNARVLHDPLFKQLHLMFADNMQFGTRSKIVHKAGPAAVDNTEVNESESNDASEDHGEDVAVEFDNDEKMKLAVLCEKYETIWNSEHPAYANLEKRDIIWASIGRKMKLTKAQVKALWTRLRNMYRGRRLRFLKGVITKDNQLLRDPLYRKLHSMLDGHMQLGKYGGGVTKKQPPRKEKEPSTVDAGPFSTMEDKVKLVEEVIKHEFLWNTTHRDYFKSDMRGATWAQIAGMFDNCDAWGARSEWRRLRNMHRPRKSRGVIQRSEIDDDDEEDATTSNNPLYELFSRMAQSLTAENEGEPTEEGAGESSRTQPKVRKRRIQEVTEAYMTHKRRFTGKRSFDDEGCIKVVKGGIVRYEKICELCGKQVERSYFEYHMNQHNGLKPYVCSFEGCDRQYSNKITRDRHEVLVHCDEGYKYECDQCDEKFKYRSTFDYHYAIKHKSHKVPCSVCGKLLKHKSLLREHLRRHTGHFPCDVCGKILQKKYSLDVHMRTHTNEKPYPCEICGQCFMLKVQMKTHLAKVHQLSWEEFQTSYGSTNQQ